MQHLCLAGHLVDGGGLINLHFTEDDPGRSWMPTQDHPCKGCMATVGQMSNQRKVMVVAGISDGRALLAPAKSTTVGLLLPAMNPSGPYAMPDTQPVAEVASNESTI